MTNEGWILVAVALLVVGLCKIVSILYSKPKKEKKVHVHEWEITHQLGSVWRTEIAECKTCPKKGHRTYLPHKEPPPFKVA